MCRFKISSVKLEIRHVHVACNVSTLCTLWRTFYTEQNIIIIIIIIIIILIIIVIISFPANVGCNAWLRDLEHYCAFMRYRERQSEGVKERERERERVVG